MGVNLVLALAAIASTAFLVVPRTSRWCTLRVVWGTVLVCRILVGMLAVTGSLLWIGDRSSMDTDLKDIFYAIGWLILIVIAALPVVVLPIAIELSKRGFGEDRRRHTWWPTVSLIPVAYLAGEVVLSRV